MFWLVLVSFLGTDVPPVPAAFFKDRDACLAAASKANHVGPLSKPRPEGQVYVCLGLVYPS